MSSEHGSQALDAGDVDARTTRLVVELDRTVRWGLWALPVWTVLLFLGTLTHQPDPQTNFAGFAAYVTTTEFLISHIVASIIGAGVGVLGLLALFTFLALRVRSRLAIAGLALAVLGNVMICSVFGVAAFGQPAVGRLHLAGQSADALTTYNDMYGAPLTATATAAVLLLVAGVIALGITVTRSRVVAPWTGIGMAVGIVVFGVIGVILADLVQSIGAVLLVASTTWLAYDAMRSPSIWPDRASS